KGVAAGRERIGDEVFELARLVAPERDARIAVVALGPDRRPAGGTRQAAERMDRRRTEQQRVPGERVDRHEDLSRAGRTGRRPLWSGGTRPSPAGAWSTARA